MVTYKGVNVYGRIHPFTKGFNSKELKFPTLRWTLWLLYPTVQKKCGRCLTYVRKEILPYKPKPFSFYNGPKLVWLTVSRSLKNSSLKTNILLLWSKDSITDLVYLPQGVIFTSHRVSYFISIITKRSNDIYHM